MPSPFEKTRYPGIYRRGERYAVRQRDASGRMIQQSAATLAEARAIQASLRFAQSSGEHVPRPVSLAAYADGWIDSYAGRTGRGFRDSSRDDYRATLVRHVKPYFGTMRLTDIQPL